jgi:hypothetical protein
MVVDSASDVTCLTPTSIKLLNLSLISDPKSFMSASDGASVLSPGYVIVNQLCVGTLVVHDVKIRVCQSDQACAPSQGILGLDIFPQLGITVEGVPTNFPQGEVEHFVDDTLERLKDWSVKCAAPDDVRQVLMQSINASVVKNRNIPSGSFCSYPAAKVCLVTGTAKPVYVQQYPLSDLMSQYVDKQVLNWETDGIVVDAPIDSPWNFPLLAAWDRAAKLKGKDPRVCIDPRLLNNLLPDDPRPIPNVDNIHQRIKGFKYISELDLTKSFNQIRVNLEDQLKTTFTWKGKRRMFAGAPFGLKPLSQLFQALIEQILDGTQEFAISFIDNIYVYSNDMEEHAKQVNHVVGLLNKFDLRLNLDKCFFGYTAINVLGHVLTGQTKTVDPYKVSVLHDWPNPTTGKDIERFLGFTNYLRRYMPKYSEVAFPLEKLRKVKKIISGENWGEAEQKSKDTFIKVLSNPPVLHVALPDVPFCLQTDASQYGVGWALYQIDPITKQPRYILFGAKALNKGQYNYSATKRELLAIVLAIANCRQWLYGRHFTLYTDHQALTFLYTQKHINYMMLNWVDILFDYDFTVVHRPGILMILPDALSRMFAPGENVVGQKIRIVSSVNKVKYPDRELYQFINQRFGKKFLPADQRAELLERTHNTGHFDADELFKALWDNDFYWPNMRQDCLDQVNSCLQCLRYNVGKAGYHPRQTIDANLPFEHICVDTISGFPTTERGNNYVLVIADVLTRYKLFFPLQTHAAKEVAEKLWFCMCTFPLPKIIQSDNGTEFVNATIKALTNLQGVDHRTIAAYNPRANGTAENSVGSFQDVLRKLLSGYMNEWDLHCPFVQLCMNTKLNKATQTHPASLLFGMNTNAFASYDKASSKLLTEKQLIDRYRIINSIIRPTVNAKFKTVQAKAAARADKTSRVTAPLEPGTLVMIKDRNRGTKHQPRYFGPFRIIEQTKGKVYSLLNPDHSIYYRRVPRQHLKVIDKSANVSFEETFYVERILDHKGTGSKLTYLIKWLNYPSEHNSWEPVRNLDGCEKRLEEYWQARKAAPKK